MRSEEQFSGLELDEKESSGNRVNPLDIIRIEKKITELSELVNIALQKDNSSGLIDYSEIAQSYYDEAIKELNTLENLTGKKDSGYRDLVKIVASRILECAQKAGQSHPKYVEMLKTAERIAPKFTLQYIKEENGAGKTDNSVQAVQIDNQNLPEAENKGIIKKYFEDKGFGFILDEFNKEIFFHRADITEFSENTSLEGCAAAFALTNTPKGVKACNVKIFPTEKPLYKVADDFFIIKEGRRIPHGYILIDEFPWEIENICVDESNSDPIFRSRLEEIGANAVINVTRKLSTSTERKFGGGTKYSTLYNIKGTVARIGELSNSGVDVTELADLNKKCESKYKALKRAYPSSILVKLALFLSITGFFAYNGIIHFAVIAFAYGTYNTIMTKKKRVWISKKE